MTRKAGGAVGAARATARAGAGGVNLMWGRAKRDDAYCGLLDEAREAIRCRDLARAERAARSALRQDPERAAAYNILAIVRELQGRRSAAMDMLRAGIAVEPTYGPAWANLARLGAHPRGPGALELGGDES